MTHHFRDKIQIRLAAEQALVELEQVVLQAADPTDLEGVEFIQFIPIIPDIPNVPDIPGRSPAGVYFYRLKIEKKTGGAAITIVSTFAVCRDCSPIPIPSGRKTWQVIFDT